ncbi:MAG: biopolymer transporter ExbD [Spirochaetaceae bacterium]|nr:biopolymer transporter ExbD [Myxococcales bacterium]MCB9724622.1 biopolymer transporter ExbD [Spirochaetaceae bacterium]
MRRRRSGRIDDEAEVDLTPMLDVVFIMLIFFIVTASFVKEVGLDLNRPEGGGNPKTVESNKNILVQISNDGLIFVDRRPVDIRAVRPNIERLHAERPDGQVIIAAGPAAFNGLLVEVMDQARLAGVEEISLAAEVN